MARSGLALAAAALALLAGARTATADEPLKIGFVASLSSPTSAAGRDLLIGFKRYYKGAIKTETYTLANAYVERIVADHADSSAAQCKMP
jgi:hypothetical protein